MYGALLWIQDHGWVLASGFLLALGLFSIFFVRVMMVRGKMEDEAAKAHL